jgi:serine/threonine-protein kinase 24/25/MST4
MHRQGGDEDDLWDFGTVRHSATMGRAQGPVMAEGLANGSIRSRVSPRSNEAYEGPHNREESQGTSQGSSITVKGEIATRKPNKDDEYEGTVRRSAPPARVPPREPSDDYDDEYDRDYPEYSGLPPPSDDDVPDSTMLDSVVLPTIASVRVYGLSLNVVNLT